MDELAKSQATLVFGQMNEPPGARARVALSGLSVAEHFRDGDEGDAGGRDILFFVDNISVLLKRDQRYRPLLGRMPSAVGYQPTLATEMGLMQSELPLPNEVRLHQYKRYTYLRMTTDPAPATTVCSPRCNYCIGVTCFFRYLSSG